MTVILAAGVVVLLVLLVPKLLGRSRGSAPPAAAAPAAARKAPTRAPQLPRLAGDPQPVPAPGQLSSFSLFSAKDPFAPQPATAPAAPAPTPPTPAATAGSRALLSAQGRIEAVISVDGQAESVRVGASFPAAGPVFTLVSATADGAQIGIAGGSYASGASTVTLSPGTPLTLVNTRNEKRYELTLLTAS